MNKSEQLIACLEGEIAKRDARIVEMESDLAGTQSRVLSLQDQWRKQDAELAALKAQGVVMPAELDRAFITGESCDGVYRVVIQSETLKEMQAVHRWLARLNAAPCQHSRQHWNFTGGGHCDDCGAPIGTSVAAPAQRVSVPDGATLILGDTGRKDLDRLIDRLMSSDPDFEDCTAAAALLRRLFMEEIIGPKGHATWKDAAVAERLRRVSMRPSETVVAMAREGLAVYSGPNMNEHKVCAEIVRLADISDTAMLAAPAAPAADTGVNDHD